jgi:hypothetical protein
MANKRTLKRQVKYMIYDVIDECYFISGTQDGKDADAEATIQKAIDFHEEILPQIGRAKNKADFKGVMSIIEAKQTEFVELLNGLN